MADGDRGLIGAGLACYERYGLRKTSISDVADQAGVSRATAYRAFGSQRGLLTAVLEAEIERFVSQLETMLSTGAPVAESLPRIIEFALGWVRAHPIARRVLDDETALLANVLIAGPEEPSLITLATARITPALAASQAVRDLGIPAEQLAEWCVRAVISFVLTPATTLGDARAISELLLRGADHSAPS
jgi:AcrR family transcriptional regulator